jgi:hypothetical protein
MSIAQVTDVWLVSQTLETAQVGLAANEAAHPRALGNERTRHMASDEAVGSRN